MSDVDGIMELLIQRRHALRLRQADIAEAVGVGQQLVSHWEAGRHVTLQALQGYADAVGLRLVLSLTPQKRD